MSFFQKSSPGPASSPLSKVSPDSPCLKETTKANSLPKTKLASSRKAKLSTPVPSSDAPEPPSSQENRHPGEPGGTLPSPTTMSAKSRQASTASPSRKVRVSIVVNDSR